MLDESIIQSPTEFNHPKPDNFPSDTSTITPNVARTIPPIFGRFNLSFRQIAEKTAIKIGIVATSQAVLVADVY